MKRNAIDYHVSVENNINDLIITVKDCVSQGWQPVGGHRVSIITNRDGVFVWAEYSQTLVKYETEGAAK